MPARSNRTTISRRSFRNLRQAAAPVTALEPRLLMCVDHGDGSLVGHIVPDLAPAIHLDKNLPKSKRQTDLFTATTSTTSGATFAAGLSLSAVPALNSNPTARAQLYLDFDGEPASNWAGYSVPATPAFDQDGDPSSFSPGELDAIAEIWARAAEKYSPFNLNVTTVNPGSFADKTALKVVIGGNGAWMGANYGGVGYVGSFANSLPNTVYVFSSNLYNAPVYVGEAVAHESGHAFGLEHQSSYSGSTKTAEYSTGNGSTAPVMGNSYYARGTWWRGTSSISSTSIQDDLAILSNATNAFGYRADDYSSSLASPSSFTLSGSTVTAKGVIERTTDLDVFSFTTAAGTVSFAASTTQFGPTLDLRLELYSAAGDLIAAADTASLGESLSLTLAGGSYRLVVASHGGYGDLGQYQVTGTIVPAADTLAAPANLTATPVSATRIDLAWSDRSANETAFTLHRSTDAGLTWSPLATLPADSTGFADASAAPGVSYTYRVAAVNASTTSDFSNPATAITAPAAPATLTASATYNQVSLAWADVAGETGFRVDRSADGGATWSPLAATAANVTTFLDTAVTGGVTYHYRVVATGAFADSAATAPASATPPIITPPSAPTNLRAVTGKNKVTLTWTDTANNESGFRVQRSTDNRTWATVATLPTNASGYNDTTARNGEFYYRVIAFNVAGESAYSSVAYATFANTKSGPSKTPARAPAPTATPDDDALASLFSTAPVTA